ncbi:MAG TPA: choice-of-anchor tandem repeat GloVer-containing protein [Verrucomicrobiae bacterium]|nr:choice-of-anchor tandem repeat GloVer-containing protein [Verrucomicrobiae bacterium]
MTREIKYALVLICISTTARPMSGQIIEVLHSFSGPDGYSVAGGLALASDGYLYGTTVRGGDSDLGTVFRITTDGVFTCVLSFANTNGAQPYATLIQGRDGNLYGTTSVGGRLDLNSGFGYGTVFKISPAAALSTVASLDGTNGARPAGKLLEASDGTLYGIATAGGLYGYGTVFKIPNSGAISTLYSFDWTNGAYPRAGVIEGSDGALYGATEGGALNSYYYGTIFRITPTGALTTLAVLPNPQTALLLASDGNFYGAAGSDPYFIYRATSEGAWTELASVGGESPVGTLFQARDGGIYGAIPMAGYIFKVGTNGLLANLARFSGSNGRLPVSELIQANDGNLYGTTDAGGANDLGTVFRLTFPTLTATRTGPYILLSWPTNQTGFNLEYSLDMTAPNWLAGPPAHISGDQYQVWTLPTVSAIYRLKK